MIYLACYKHKKKITSLRTLYYAVIDGLTRKLTRGKYSHSELVVKRNDGLYDCYSSSVRDKGVRKKKMALPARKWDIKETGKTEQELITYFEKTKDMEYDFFGAAGVAVPIKEDRRKSFCSEWCFNFLYNSSQGWRFCPNKLAAVLK